LALGLAMVSVHGGRRVGLKGLRLKGLCRWLCHAVRCDGVSRMRRAFGGCLGTRRR
jgi:hypothetical protein